MTGVELMQLAIGLTSRQIDKMAHALAWPTTPPRRGGGIKWMRPSRTYYCGAANDEDWLSLVEQGLATRGTPGALEGDRYWYVSKLGVAALKVRLDAEWEAERRRKQLAAP